ncbi:MAG: hypothetical protein V4615_09115 [Bacteroidota bacterium]
MIEFILPPIPPANEVFEILPCEEDDLYCQLKFKGKLLPPEILSAAIGGFTVTMAPEVFLDFKAAFISPGFVFTLHIPQKKCLQLFCGVSFFIKDDEAVLEFNFFDMEEETDDVFNPHSPLTAFAEMAEKAGYTITERDTDPWGCDLMVLVGMTIPLQDKVYEHYVNHVQVFEIMFRQIELEVMKAVNKN